MIERLEDCGFVVNGERIAELSDAQLETVASSGDPATVALTSAGIQSAFAEALWRRKEMKKH